MNQILARQFAELLEISTRQIFFVGGAPRSGTTWLQQILDAHPDICCRGEGFLGHELVGPLGDLVEHWRNKIEGKNSALFKHTNGFALPEAEDTDFLARTAILRALRQQCGNQVYRAIGEKTPENVFAFPALRRILPGAKFIGIARDPRDVITSTWHFFRKPFAGPDETAEKFALIADTLPLLIETHRAIMTIVERFPADAMIVTYYALTYDAERVVGELFEFLDVSADPTLVSDALSQSSFAKATGGRARGDARDGEFLRKGIVGDWRSTLTPEMNDLILREVGWMYDYYGWQA